MAAKIFMELPGGLKMPGVGFGTAGLKEDSDIPALNSALEIGYRHLDTAYVYQNEALIGRVLKEWFSSGKLKREDVFITTKLPSSGVHQDRVELFMKKSLENLQLDYVDLYLIHFPIGMKYDGEDKFGPGSSEIDPTFDHVAIWKNMEKQVDAGRTKAIGLSNFNQKQIERILKSARIKPACLQVEIHVDFQQRDLVNFCHENGIAVVAYSPLGSPGPRRFEPRPESIPEMLQNETIVKIAEKHKKTSTQVMLRFLLQKNIAVIPKSSKPERQKENINVFDFVLDSGDMKALEGLDLGEKGRLATFKFIPGILEHPEYPFKN